MDRVLTDEEIEFEVRRMSDVKRWPHMYLPVKHINEQDEDGDTLLGVILYSKEHPYDVFECNMFFLKDWVIDPLSRGEKPKCPIHHFNSFREVVESGWLGD